MIKKESIFWRKLKPKLSGELSRIENMVDSGMPDVSGAYAGIDFWIELKVCDNKTKVVDPVRLCLPAQIAWHTARGRVGSRIYIFVQYSFGIYIYKWMDHRDYILIMMYPNANDQRLKNMSFLYL